MNGSDPPGPDDFAATRWTLVQAARGDDTRARDALGELCTAYYAPVVAFLRRDGRSDDDARELAHGFFARVLEGGHFDAADRSRGKFRSYVLGALKHHLQQERRKQGAARRGGGIEHVALSQPTDTHAGFEVADPREVGFDREFDRRWALAVLDRAMSMLESEFERVGRRAHFDALRPWLGGEAAGESQAELAGRLGMSAGAVKVAIHRLRQRFREVVKEEIAHTVGGGEAEVREELNHLLSSVG
ncbi:MAG: RNA polymerase sigma factor [Verrucomicrobiales bacterium]